MHGRQKWALALFAALTLSINEVNECVAEPYQPHRSFEAAIRDRSTSPYVVLVTAIDDRTGEAHTGCTTANLLRGAIYMQTWGQSGTPTVSEDKSRGDEVRRILTENTSHVFRFSDPAALQNVIVFPISAQYPEGCDAIARGIRARIADRTGQLLLGPFIKEPEIVWQSCPFPLSREANPNNPKMPTVSLLIAPDGTLTESKVTNSSGSRGLDEAARAALSACKYTPRTIDDDPAQEATWFTVQIYGGWPFRY